MSVNEQSSGKPVALLARAGKARDKLRAGLGMAGGRIVLEDDPQALQAEVVRAAGPEVVVVALEPAIEDALEALDPVLQSPELLLIFEEADIAARRDGWEEQRWVRHLAAKLHGHDQVLPPGAGDESAAVNPVTVAHGELVSPPLVTAEGWSADGVTASEEVLVASGYPDGSLAGQWSVAETVGTSEEPVAVVSERFDAFDDLPSDVAPFNATEQAPVPSWDDIVALESAREPMPEAAAPSSPPPLPPLDTAPPATPPSVPAVSSWSLVSDDDVVVTTPVQAPKAEVSSFLSRELSLVELESNDSAAHAGGESTRRVALVLAGIGGPDAVRRVLAELPDTLPGAVLVQMQLNGGRYDNLVRQMERVARLPVQLAEAGHPVEVGHVYILPDQMALAAGEQGYRFAADTSGDIIGKLNPRDAAVLMLSGADTTSVDAALAFSVAGGFVAGQSGSGCYAPEAANLLAAAGMMTAAPEQLSQELATRWGA